MSSGPDIEKLLQPARIEALANGGAGILRDGAGRVVFVPHTAVGDLVRCRIVRRKKNYAEAQLAELLEPGPGRRTPPCPVAGTCGGCQWQHLTYVEQAAWKERLFRETLVRQCDVEAERILPLLSAADEWNYRSRAQIKCHNTPAGLVTGFYRPQSRFVVGVDCCPILAPSLNELLGRLRSLLNGTSHAALIPQLDLAVADDGKRCVVVHYLGNDLDGLSKLLVETDLHADLLIQAGSKACRSLLRGDALLGIRVGDPPLLLNYRAGGFAQVNLVQNSKLVDDLLALRDWSREERVLDLFCGMGNFSLPLARLVKHVVGVEESSVSIDMARQNARMNGLPNLTFHARQAEGARADNRDADIVVLDPPRSGAYSLMKELVAEPARAIVYISCDPQTLARDLKPLLHGGYRLVSSRPYDLFPQTHHCESITLLERE